MKGREKVGWLRSTGRLGKPSPNRGDARREGGHGYREDTERGTEARDSWPAEAAQHARSDRVPRGGDARKSGHLREGYPCRKPFRERYGEKGSACVKSTRSAAMVELRTRPAIERVGVGHPRPTANGRPERSPADTPQRLRATRSETRRWNLAPPWWN